MTPSPSVSRFSKANSIVIVAGLALSLIVVVLGRGSRSSALDAAAFAVAFGPIFTVVWRPQASLSEKAILAGAFTIAAFAVRWLVDRLLFG